MTSLGGRVQLAEQIYSISWVSWKWFVREALGLLFWEDYSLQKNQLIEAVLKSSKPPQ
jgi:hypothetical protein